MASPCLLKHALAPALPRLVGGLHAAQGLGTDYTGRIVAGAPKPEPGPVNPPLGCCGYQVVRLEMETYADEP